GEIVDEFDVEDPLVEPLPGGILRVDGRLSIDDANDVLDGELPSGDWNSVGGLIFTQLGRVPVGGEIVDVPGYQIRVERMQGRRIARVRIVARTEEDPADPGDADADEDARGAAKEPSR
ncbi:MAG TPA: transporter associated domain-containing protein, partial [Acidimicrobiales bacterium]|nr:transporter associated domain-containing protein [Acidimicrobiales bacterium]